MATTALVLGAGGITGVAWHLGIVLGLRAEGVDLTGADLVVGTSAGAISGALLAGDALLGGDAPLEGDALLGGGTGSTRAAILTGPTAADVPPMEPDWTRGAEAFALLNSDAPADEVRRRLGALALAADVGPQETVLDAFRRWLPLDDWPTTLVVTAVDAYTGDPVSWTAASGVPILAAVAASCAVPCIFPPVTVNGSRYVDGGVRSRTNADLAAGHDRVVILAPRMPLILRDALASEMSQLGEGTVLLEPDAASQEAIGGNVFAAGRWPQILTAATAQGRAAAAALS